MQKILLALFSILIFISCAGEQNNSQNTETKSSGDPTGYINASEVVKPESDDQKFSYSIGYLDAQSLKQRDSAKSLEFDYYFNGFLDGLKDQPEFYTDQEIKNLVFDFTQELMKEERRLRTQAEYEQQKLQLQEMPENMRNLALENKRKAEEFMAEKAKDPEIRSTPIGALYKVIEEGDGISPDITSSLTMDVKLSLLDGTVINDTQGKGPISFKLNELVPGWAEVVEQMRTGSEVIAYIPPEAAYGVVGSGNIPPNALLIVEMKLQKLSARKR